jgi:hypothetical protein
MIKGKVKFLQTSFETEELGARKGIMQDFGTGKGKGETTKTNHERADVKTENEGNFGPGKAGPRNGHQHIIQPENDIKSDNLTLPELTQVELISLETTKVRALRLLNGERTQWGELVPGGPIGALEEYKMLQGAQSMYLRYNDADKVMKVFHVDMPEKLNKQQTIEWFKNQLDAKEKEITNYQNEINTATTAINNIITTEYNNDGNLAAANKNLEAAKKNKEAAQLEVKHQQEANEITPKEADLFNLIKKYDILNNPKGFQELVEKSKGETSEEAKVIQADATRIEQDLKDLKLGKFVKSDGIIEQSELDAITSEVSKKMAAIIKFKEATGIDLINAPSAGGTKPEMEKGGK